MNSCRLLIWTAGLLVTAVVVLLTLRAHSSHLNPPVAVALEKQESNPRLSGALPVSPSLALLLAERSMHRAAPKLQPSLGGGWSDASRAEFAAFCAWTKRYFATPSGGRAALLAEGEQLAIERRKSLARLIRDDPKAALRAAVPIQLRDSLPPSIRALLEDTIAGRGDLLAVGITSPADESSSAKATLHWVQMGTERYEAFVYGRREFQPTTRNVPLYGIALDGVMAVGDSAVQIVGSISQDQIATGNVTCRVCGIRVGSAGIAARIGTAEATFCQADHVHAIEADLVADEGQATHVNGGHLEGTGAPDASWTTGTKRVLIIRVDFPDVPGAPRYPGGRTLTESYVSEFFAHTVSPWFDTVSYGALQLNSTVSLDVYRMPRPASSYATSGDVYALAQDAVAAASAQYAVNGYDRVCILTSNLGGIPGSRITFAGASEIQSKVSWINGYLDLRVVSHEFGHGLGLYHANLWQVSDGNAISEGGYSQDYGDALDAMGGRGGTERYHYNVWFKSLLHWLPDSAVLRPTTSGVYRIHQMDVRNARLSDALAIVIPGAHGRNYWLSYRGQFPALANTLVVNWGYASPRPSDLLDLSEPGVDAEDSGLHPGETFVDPENGLSLRVVATDGSVPTDYIDVEVSINGAIPSSPLPTSSLESDTLSFVPTNDNFANSITLAATGTLSGNNSTATIETSEPVAYSSNTHSVWYTWTAPQGGLYIFDTVGSTFDTTLGIYTGSSLTGLTRIAQDDDSGGGLTSRIQLSATAGTTYRIAVDGLSGSSGNFVLNWARPGAPQITSPSSVTTTVGASVYYYINTLNNIPATFTVSTLPSGLHLSGATISGTPASAGSWTVQITSTNENGSSVTPLTIEVLDLPPPVITSSLSASVQIGGYFNYSIAATNFPSAFNALGLPPGLTVNQTGGYISGAIVDSPSSVGEYWVTLVAANGRGTATATLVIYVTPRPAPVITSSLDVQVYRGGNFSYSIYATNSPLYYNAEGLPPGLTLTSYGYITGTPASTGDFMVTLRAANNAGTGSANLWIHVVAPPVPVITNEGTFLGTVGASFGTYINYTSLATSVSATGLPPGITIDNLGYMSGQPSVAGTYNTVISATNSSGTGTRTYKFVVNSQPIPQITSSLYQTALRGNSFYTYISATGNPTSYSATGLPAGLSISGNSISGIPSVSGRYTITLGATNGAGTGTASFILDVQNPTPTWQTVPVLNGVTGRPFSYTITANNSPTVFSANSLPTGLTVNTSTGVISGQPLQAGTFSITLGAGNASGTAYANATLVVTNPPPPVITSSLSVVAQMGSPFSYAIGTDIYTNFFNAEGLPRGLSIDLNTGIISGTPTVYGFYSVILRAANYGGTAIGTLSINISPQLAPVITSAGSASAKVGDVFAYQISASGSPIAYNAGGLPPGMTVNQFTGAITGTPTVPGRYGIEMRAANYAGTAVAILTIDVAPATPVIVSSLNVVTYVGSPFTYTITAANSALYYNAVGLPPGLSIDLNTGIITGTPTGTGGLYAVGLAAANTGGTGTATLWINVQPSPDQAQMELHGAVGYPFDFQIPSQTGRLVEVRGLPSELRADVSAGSIEGTPLNEGSFQLRVIRNIDGRIAETAYLLTIDRAPVGALISSDQSDTILYNETTALYAVGRMSEGRLVSLHTLPVLPAGTQPAGIGDFDGDGRGDILLQNTSTGSLTVWLFDGVAVKSIVPLSPIPNGSRVAVVGDFNGDRYADIIVADGVTHQWILRVMNRFTVQTSHVLPPAAPTERLCGMADFDNDGIGDLLVQDIVTGTVTLRSLSSSGMVFRSTVLPAEYSALDCVGVAFLPEEKSPWVIMRDPDTGRKSAQLFDNGMPVQTVDLDAPPTGWSIVLPAQP